MTSGTYSGAAATQRVMAEEAAAAVLTPTVAVATEAAAATARKQLGFLLTHRALCFLDSKWSYSLRS